MHRRDRIEAYAAMIGETSRPPLGLQPQCIFRVEHYSALPLRVSVAVVMGPVADFFSGQADTAIYKWDCLEGRSHRESTVKETYIRRICFPNTSSDLARRA